MSGISHRLGRRLVFLAAVTAAATAVQMAPAQASTESSNTNRVLAVPYYHQQYNDDCEAAALRMLLAYRHHNLTDAQILTKIHVDLAHPYAGYSGSRSGDPYVSFVGNPKGEELYNTGFGVYYPRIAAVAKGEGLSVLKAGQGISPSSLYQAVAAGHPAEVWVDYLWRAKTPHYYTAFDGARVLYAGPAEHAVVVAGVTARYVLIDDPARGRYWLSKSRFEAGYSTYRDMAVVVR